MKTNSSKKNNSKNYTKTHNNLFKDDFQTIMHRYEWLNNNNYKWQLKKKKSFRCLKCDL